MSVYINYPFLKVPNFIKLITKERADLLPSEFLNPSTHFNETPWCQWMDHHIDIPSLRVEAIPNK